MPDSGDRRDHSSPIAFHVATLAFFAVLTLLVTRPLATHLSDAVIGAGAGDNMSALWNVWWARTALRGPDSLFQTPELFAPLGTSLVLHSLSPLESVAAALAPVSEPVTAYNLALLLSVFLNFVCAYL